MIWGYHYFWKHPPVSVLVVYSYSHKKPRFFLHARCAGCLNSINKYDPICWTSRVHENVAKVFIKEFADFFSFGACWSIWSCRAGGGSQPWGFDKPMGILRWPSWCVYLANTWRHGGLQFLMTSHSFQTLAGCRVYNTARVYNTKMCYHSCYCCDYIYDKVFIIYLGTNWSKNKCPWVNWSCFCKVKSSKSG